MDGTGAPTRSCRHRRRPCPSSAVRRWQAHPSAQTVAPALAPATVRRAATALAVRCRTKRRKLNSLPLALWTSPRPRSRRLLDHDRQRRRRFCCCRRCDRAQPALRRRSRRRVTAAAAAAPAAAAPGCHARAPLGLATAPAREPAPRTARGVRTCRTALAAALVCGPWRGGPRYPAAPHAQSDGR